MDLKVASVGGQEVLRMGLRVLIDRLNGMLTETVAWNERDIETALWIAAWLEVRRAAA